jgi:hypothetical protein
MFQSHRIAKPESFISAKTRGPIPVTHPLIGEALLQASLDPATCTIEYVASAPLFGTTVDLAAIVVTRDDGRFVLDIVEARPIRDIDAEGLALLALQDLGLTLSALTAADIRKEPRYSNCRFVWSYRDTRVGVGLRLRILQTLADEGPTALGRLLTSIRSDRDPGPAVLALACADLLALDLANEPLGPATIVRSRS